MSRRPPFRAWVRQDLAANAGSPESQLVVVLFRIAQWLHARPGPAARIGIKAYRAVTYLVLHVELPPEIVAGPGLRVFHPHAIVLNPGVVLGRDVTLRHLVTLGNLTEGGGTPVLGDRVELGAGAMVLGAVHIGDRARIGAGAVVTTDVPAGGVVAGPKATLLRVEDAQDSSEA